MGKRATYRPAFYILAFTVFFVAGLFVMSDIRHALNIDPFFAILLTASLNTLVFIIRDFMGNGNGHG